MSVIIRLQNLPWSANALDIRAFFRGLSIPDGGVHIVGGEMGDAFIAFSTDEDARQAMSMDRGKLNEVQVRLLLSSRAEMQKVIEVARNKSLSMQMQRSQQQQQNQQIILPAPQPPVITSTTLKHIMSNQQNQLSLNPMQQYQSYNQSLNLDNSQDSRDSRSDNTGDGKSRSRNRSKDRRSSTSPPRGRDRRRSTSRGRDSRRRGRDRSRSRSRSRDRKNSSRRRRSRSRDRGNNERTRWDKDSRDRDVDRKDIDKDMKKSNDHDISIILDKEVEQPPIPPPNSTKLNLWNPSGNPVFTPGSNVMQGYTTINQNMTQQQQMQTPVYQTNISAGYQSANQMFPQFNKPPPLDGCLNQTDNSQQNKFQNMLNMNNATQGNNSLNFNNLNPNNVGLQNTFNSSSFNPPGKNSPQQSNNQQLSTDIMNSLSGAGNKLTSFSGIFSSQNKKIDDNKQINDPRIQNSSNMMNKSNNSNNQNELQKNFGDINFDELRGNCIKISNMCPSTSYSDIRRFFSGLFIANNGIKMINDKHGLRIGVAYVRFVRPESKPKAFIRNGSPLKSKKILIESVTEDEFEEEIDSYKPVRRFDNNRYGNDDRPPPHIPLRGDIDNSSPRNTGDDSSSVVDNKSQAPNSSQTSKTNISVGESIDDDDDDDDNNPDNKKEENEQPFTILKLDDVPVFAKEYDIMKMFSSFTIIDILLAKNEDNKRFLKCYVKFHLPDDAKAALKNKALHIIGHKQIYVSSCSEEKFNEVKEKLNQPEIIEESMDANNINSESQKQENVNDISYDPYNPNMQGRFDNTNEDNDNNQFDNDNDDNQNINDKNSNFINNNNNNNNNRINNQPPSLLNLPPLSRLDTNLDPRRRDNKPSRFNNNSNNSSDNKMMNKNMNRFVLLKNCEYKLNKRDYAEFFATINLVPQRIEIIRNKRNQPCGECIIEFQDDIEAEKAFIKNNTLLAGRTCRMETIPPNLAAEKLGDESVRMDNDNSGFMANNMFGNNNNNNRDNMFQNQQNDNFRNNAFRQNRIDDCSRGIALDNFDNRNNNNNINNRAGNRPSRFSDNDVSNNNGGRMMGGVNNFNMNMNNRRGGGGNGDINNMPPINNSSIDQFGQPGSVVGLKNVPYKAVTEDILDFFGNFKLGPQNVIRRYNDDGAPTGDARVAFNSPMEARAAIEQMRNCKIFNRQVYLSIV